MVISCFDDRASAGITTVKPVPGTVITPPSGPTYADALTDAASGAVRLSEVTVVGSVTMPLRSSSGDDDGAAVRAGATGPSLVEQLASSAAASRGRRKRVRMTSVGKG